MNFVRNMDPTWVCCEIPIIPFLKVFRPFLGVFKAKKLKMNVNLGSGRVSETEFGGKILNSRVAISLFSTPNSNSDGTGISRAILVYSNVGVVEFGNVQLVKDKSDDSTAGVYIRTLTTVLVVIYI